MAIPYPDQDTRWRCTGCGNLTRFEVLRVTRSRDFVHVDLSGAAVVAEHEVLADTAEHVTCRWCAAVDTAVLVSRPQRAAAGIPETTPASTAPDRA